MLNKILIVEDDEFIQRTFERIFVYNNFLVELASNGEECLKKAKEESPDLILLDLLLPDINGKKVLQNLKAEHSTKKIPVVILTNVDEEGAEEEVKSLGAIDFLKKADFTPDEVVENVRSHLQS